MTAAEAATAHKLARIVGSAIRAAGNPDDPGHAFASALLDDLLQQAGKPSAPPTTGLAFDDDGNLNSGIVDATLPPEEQVKQLVHRLQEQGLSTEEALSLALDSIPLPEAGPALDPPTPGAEDWTAEDLQHRVDEVERLLLDDLAAQQAREDSLLGPEDLLAETAGGRAGTPIRPVLNGRFDTALNALADVAGLLEPLSGLQGDLVRLRAAQAEQQIDTMRQAMHRAGVANVPDYVPAWDANGNLVRDYGATVERLQESYNQHLQDVRLRETWGDNWKAVRLGNTRMTVPEFEARVLSVQQTAANEAYERGKQLLATGQLALKNGDYALTLGAYIDEQVRVELRSFARSQGLPDSGASNVFAVNRQVRGSGMVGIPDLRLGTNLMSDVTLAHKDGLTDQLRRWNVIRPNDTLIIRPSQLGGSYVVPRSTIRPIVAPGRGS